MWQLKSKIAFMNIVVRTSTFYIQQNGYNTYMLPQSTYTYIEWYRELWTPKGANFNDARQVSRGVEPPFPLPDVLSATYAFLHFCVSTGVLGVAYLCRFRLSDLLPVPGNCYGM